MKIENTTRGEFFRFKHDDENLVIVTDSSQFLYKSSIHDPLNEEFLNGIREFGILHNVIAKRDKVSGKYLVTNGRQRVRAVREIFKRYGEELTIPVTISVENDANCEIISVITNEHVRHESIREKGESIKVLIGRGVPESKIEKIYGKTWQTISGWVAISESPEAQAAIASGAVTPSQAAVIAKSKNPIAKLKEIKTKPEGRCSIIGERISGEWRIKIKTSGEDSEGFFEALLKKITSDHAC